MKHTPQNELTPKGRKLKHLKINSQELLVEGCSPALWACTGVPEEWLSKVLEKGLRHKDAVKTLGNPQEHPELVKTQGLWGEYERNMGEVLTSPAIALCQLLKGR